MLSHIPVICALPPPQLSNDKPLPQVCWQQTTCNSLVLFSFPSSFPCPSRKHLSAVSFCPHSSSGCSPGSVILWRISILGWVFGLPHCSDPTLWVGGISQIMGLSHRRQTALLNRERFYPQVVFWVGRRLGRGIAVRGWEWMLLMKAIFLANTENYDLSATKTPQKLESSSTSGGFSEVLDGNQKILHLH